MGTAIIITVLGTNATQVCLKITASREIVVDRAEAHQRKLAATAWSTS
jgi:sRNA-binding carbon storage regulator CsrA